MSGKWSTEEEAVLISLYGQGFSFSQIRDKNDLMAKRYKANPMSLRDKVFGLQKQRVKSGIAMGELNEPLMSQKYDYRNYAKSIKEGSITVRKSHLPSPHLQKKKEVDSEERESKGLVLCCPSCQKVINYEPINVLSCDCGITIYEILDSLDKILFGKSVVYVIQRKIYHNLSDPVEYVGVTSNLKNRLESHERDFFNPSEMSVRIFLHMFENEAILMFKPKRNDASYSVFQLPSVQLSALIDVTPYLQLPKTETVKFCCSSGILFGQAQSTIFLDFCFKRDHRLCRCSVQCSVRRIVNNLKRKYLPGFGDIDLCYPFSKDEVGDFSNEVCDNYVPIKRRKLEKVGATCSLKSNDFLEEVMMRNEETRLENCKKYLQVLLRIKKDGLLILINCPTLLVKELFARGYALNTIRSKLLTLKLFLRNLSIKEKDILFAKSWLEVEEALLNYYDFIVKIHDEKTLLQEKSESQEKKWVPWDTIERILPDVYYKGSDQEYLMLLLMVKQQTLRNDYATLKFINFEEQILSSLNESTDNYVDFKEMVFVWNNYKTAKTYGQMKYPINEEVQLELKKTAFRRLNEGKDFFFKGNNGERMRREEFGIQLNDLTYRFLGRRIGSQMMRQIYTSSKRNNDLSAKDSLALSRSLMHSENMSSLTYRKL